MKVIDKGHIYELDQLGDNNKQYIKFIKRSSEAVHYDQEWSGLQTQEVLRVLIDRTIFLDSILECAETKEAIVHLRMALYMYEVRAYRRKLEHKNLTDKSHIDTNTPHYNPVMCEDTPFDYRVIEEYNKGIDEHILL